MSTTLGCLLAALSCEPKAGATTLKDGDTVQVVGLEPSGDIVVGSFPFRSESFTFNYAVIGAANRRGSAVFVTGLAEDGSIQSATVTERYDAPACSIVGSFAK